MRRHHVSPAIVIAAVCFTAAITTMSLVPPVSADAASDAFRAAEKAGDDAAMMRAQSFLAPPYCYDLNRWHGVMFSKAVNGRVGRPAFSFVYQDMADLKVRTLYDRAGIAAMEKASKTELDLIMMISDWANAQWGHTQPLPYPTWDAHEILDRSEKGDAFWCTFKAALFVQACNAAGITARMLGINKMDQDAHTVTEVYSNEFRKWVLVDPWMNCHFERDGIPLSAIEFHNAMNDFSGIDIVFGANGYGTEYWDMKTGKATSLPHTGKRMKLVDMERHGLIDYYFDIRIVLRNDHTTHPQQKENITIDGALVPYNSRGGEWWGPQLHYTDSATPPLITCDNSGDIGDFEWPLNEVKVDLKKVTLPGEPLVLEASFATSTPSFARYDLLIDNTPVSFAGDTYRWKLNPGLNRLTVSSVNTAGRRGFTSEFVIDYDPSLVTFPRTASLTIANPGFEESDPKEGAKKPAGWGTITSNALGAGVFERDTSVKHTGAASLKASPARDPKAGIEYAFIVKTDTFDINPASDVAYSVWLRADKDNTPVDICLLDATAKGQGTYVKRVTVGRKWEKYDLVCRIHNELTKAYLGFKVYSGTVWADDAAIAEVGKP